MLTLSGRERRQLHFRGKSKNRTNYFCKCVLSSSNRCCAFITAARSSASMGSAFGFEKEAWGGFTAGVGSMSILFFIRLNLTGEEVRKSVGTGQYLFSR